MSRSTWQAKDLSTVVITFAVTLTISQGTYAVGEVLSNTATTTTPSLINVNGTPVVNIVAPDANGLSHNTFIDFNVPQQGLVFNNSTVAGFSNLVGDLSANANLNNQSASLILNEVTGANPSALLGYMEVFGASASLVIANPNGIYANGAGFLNTPHVVLTTGVPVLEQNGLGFNVTKGVIATEGNPIDLRFTQITDLVAKQLVLNAPLVGTGTIGLYAGQGVFNGSSFSNTQQTQSNQLAIDASALGAMSAGRIFIVSNDLGAGVKLDGKLSATADNIDISANGDITLNNAHAKRDVDISSQAHKLTLNGQVLAGDNGRFDGENMTINGSVATNKRLDLHVTGDLLVTGQAVAGTTLNVDGANNLVNKGLLYGVGNTHIEMGTIDNQQGLILSESILDLATLKGDLNNTGKVIAGKELNINSANNVLNAQQAELGSLGKTRISSVGDIVNEKGTISSNANMQLYAGGDILQRGLIDTKGTVTLRGDTLALTDNQRIFASGNVDLLPKNQIQLKSGEINTTGQLNLHMLTDVVNELAVNAVGVNISTPATFTNLGTIDTTDSLNLNIGHSITNKGRLYTEQQLELTLNQSLYNDGGVIAADNGLIIKKSDTANDVVNIENYNEALLASNAQLELVVDGKLNNQEQSRIEAIGMATIQAGMLTNKDSTIKTAGELALTIFDEAGINDTDIAINNDGGKIVTASKLVIDTDKDISNAGVIYAQSDLTVQSYAAVKNLDNAVIASDAKLNMNVDGEIDTQKGLIAALGDASLSSGQAILLHDAKNYSFAGNLTLQANVIANVKENQAIYVGGDLNLIANHVLSPQFVVKHDVIIDANEVSSVFGNSSGIGFDLGLSSGIDPSSQLVAGHDIKTNVSHLNLEPGFDYKTSTHIQSVWQAGNDVIMTSTPIIEGLLIANRDIITNGVYLTGEDWPCRTECKILAGRDILSDGWVNNSGEIEAGRNIQINGNYSDGILDDDKHPKLLAGFNLNMVAPNYVQNSGVIAAGNNISLKTETLYNGNGDVNNPSKINALNTLVLDAVDVFNTGDIKAQQTYVSANNVSNGMVQTVIERQETSYDVVVTESYQEEVEVAGGQGSKLPTNNAGNDIDQTNQAPRATNLPNPPKQDRDPNSGGTGGTGGTGGLDSDASGMSLGGLQIVIIDGKRFLVGPFSEPRLLDDFNNSTNTVKTVEPQPTKQYVTKTREVTKTVKGYIDVEKVVFVGGSILGDVVVVKSQEELKNLGNIAASQALQLESLGNLQSTGNISSDGHALVTAANKIAINGQLTAKEDLWLEGNDVSLSGSETSEDELKKTKQTKKIAANNMVVNAANTLDIQQQQLDVQKEVTLLAKNNITVEKTNIKAGDKFAAQSSNLALKEGEIQAKQMELLASNTLEASGALKSNTDIALQAKTINSTANVAAQNNITMLGDNVRQSGALSAQQAVVLGAKNNITLTGSVQSAGDVSVQGETVDISLEQSRVKQLSASANQNLSLSGQLTAKETVQAYAGQKASLSGTINSTNTAIQANHIDNRAALTAQSSIAMNANQITNQAALSGQNGISLLAQNQLSNQGNLTGKSVVLAADNVDTTGTLKAQNNLIVDATSQATVSGQLQSSKDVLVRGQSVVNSANISGGGAVNVLASETISSQGDLTGQSLVLTANTVDTKGTLTAQDNLIVDATSQATVSGQLQSRKDVLVRGQNIANSANVSGGNTVALLAKENVLSEGEVRAKNLVIEANNVATQNKLTADDVSIYGASNVTNAAAITANNVSLSAISTVANTAKIIASNDVSLIAKMGSVTNIGELAANNVYAQGLFLNNLANISAKKDTYLEGSAFALNTGNINAANTAQVASQGLLMQHSNINAKNVDVQSNALFLSGGLTGDNVAVGGQYFLNFGSKVNANSLSANIGTQDINNQLLPEGWSVKKDLWLKTAGNVNLENTTINLAGNLGIDAGKNVSLKGVGVSTGGNLSLASGGNLDLLLSNAINTPWTWNQSVEQQFGGSKTVLNAGGNLVLNSGGNLTSQASTMNAGGNLGLKAGGSVLLQDKAFTRNWWADNGKGYDAKSETDTLVSRLNAGQKLSIESGNNILTQGAILGSGLDTQLLAQGDIQLGSSINEVSSDGRYGKRHITTYNNYQLTQEGTQINAGGGLYINTAKAADGSILTKNDAGGVSTIGAKINTGSSTYIYGENVDLLAAKEIQDRQYSETKKKSFAGINLGKSTSSLASHQELLQGSELIAGKDVGLLSRGDINIVSSKVSAGNNILAKAGLDGKGSLNIVGDIANSSQSTSQSKSNLLNAKANSQTINTQEYVGSVLEAKNNLALSSADDIKITGSTVAAEGDLALQAGKNIVVNAGISQQTIEDMASKKKTTLLPHLAQFNQLKEKATQTQQIQENVGSTLAGNTITSIAGNDQSIAGSTLVGSEGIKLSAGNNLSISTNQLLQQAESNFKTKTIGLYTQDATINAGYKGTAQKSLSDALTQVGSNLYAQSGTIDLQAGNKVTVQGSTVSNSTGDVNLTGKTVDVIDAQNTSSSLNQSKQLSVGVSAGFGGSVGQLVQSGTGIHNDLKRADEVDNSHLQALKQAQAIEKAYQAKKAVEAIVSATQEPLLTADVSVGRSGSISRSTSNSSSSVGSSLNAGNNLTLNATQGDVNVVGSSLNANKEIAVSATDNINLTSGQNSHENKTTNKAYGDSIGVGVSISSGEASGGIQAKVNASYGKDVGSGTSYNETTFKSNVVKLSSGQDTTLAGAVVTAEHVKALVGGSLKISSQQDTANFKSDSKGGNIAAGLGTVNGSVNKGDIDADYRSVQEQSGFFAGAGGFNIQVAGNTQLTGGAIASSATPNNNSLTTGTLSTQDLQNQSKWTAQQIALSTNALGNLAFKEGDKQSGVTQSVVEKGTLTITNPTQQSQNLDGLLRDSSNANGSLANNFDVKKVKEQQELVTELNSFGFRMAGNLAQQYPDVFEEGSPAKMALHGVVGLLSGSISGGALQGMTTAAANEWLTAQVKDYLKDKPLTNNQKALIHSMVSGVAGYALSGEAGANIAMQAVQNNYLTHAQANKLRKDLSECKDQACKDTLLFKAKAQSKMNDDALIEACKVVESNACINHLQALFEGQTALQGLGSEYYLNKLDYNNQKINQAANDLKLVLNPQTAYLAYAKDNCGGKNTVSCSAQFKEEQAKGAVTRLLGDVKQWNREELEKLSQPINEWTLHALAVVYALNETIFPEESLDLVLSITGSKLFMDYVKKAGGSEKAVDRLEKAEAKRIVGDEDLNGVYDEQKLPFAAVNILETKPVNKTPTQADIDRLAPDPAHNWEPDIDEANAAFVLEQSLGMKLERKSIPSDVNGKQTKSPDYHIESGPKDLIGKKVDLMLTDTTKKEGMALSLLTKKGEKNFKISVLEHLDPIKSDIAAIDIRGLPPASIDVIKRVISSLTPQQQMRVILIKGDVAK